MGWDAAAHVCPGGVAAIWRAKLPLSRKWLTAPGMENGSAGASPSLCGHGRKAVSIKFKTKPQRLASGFTLVEVLVTLVILSTGIVMLLRALQTSVTGLERARDTLFASLLCRERLVEIEAGIRTGGRPPTSSRGAFEGIYAAYRWSMEAAQEEAVKPDSEKATGGDDAPAVTLYRIRIETWREGREDKQQAETYLVY